MNYRFPPSVNWHICTSCNMRCKFCFAVFGDVRKELGGAPHLPLEENLQIAEVLGRNYSKVSVAGGEPLTYPNLFEILTRLKECGTITSLVTNGAELIGHPDRLEKMAPYLDWVGISIDSFRPSVHEALGRCKAGRSYGIKEYLHLARHIRQLGMRLKINTVVNRLNLMEDMSLFINEAKPERWKIFQVLPIQGQNDGSVDDLLISASAFESYCNRHHGIIGVAVIPESNDFMKGSYAMVAPDGRFFDNTTGELRYSPRILDVGLHRAWHSIEFHYEKFMERGGQYQY